MKRCRSCGLVQSAKRQWCYACASTDLVLVRGPVRWLIAIDAWLDRHDERLTLIGFAAVLLGLLWFVVR